MTSLRRALAAEFVGTALLVAVVVGSGIMGERLSPANAGIALLANSLATGLGLYVLILVLAPISGAHFNPLVTLLAITTQAVRGRDAALFIAVQFAGAAVGVALANAMFDLPVWALSSKGRTGSGQLLAEAVATFGLLATVVGTRAYGVVASAAAIAAYLVSAYWFTASTSFANPVVTLARMLTPTFSGIAPTHVMPFVGAQIAGAFVAIVASRWLVRPPSAASICSDDSIPDMAAHRLPR